MSDDEQPDDQRAKQKTKNNIKKVNADQAAPLRKMPSIREIAINILLNMSLFITDGLPVMQIHMIQCIKMLKRHKIELTQQKKLPKLIPMHQEIKAPKLMTLA